MNILGINFFFHDSSACLVANGVLVSAIEEERLTRHKYDGGPYASMIKILEYTDQIDFLVVAHTQNLEYTAGKVDFSGDDVYTGLARKLGLIKRTGLQYWSAQRLQNITVTYTAGYSDTEVTAEDIPADLKFVSARIAGRLFTASASLSTQQSTGEVSTNIADNTTDSKFQLVKSERLGDYQAEYESVLDQMNQEVLTDADKGILNKYKKQFFTSASILD